MHSFQQPIPAHKPSVRHPKAGGSPLQQAANKSLPSHVGLTLQQMANDSSAVRRLADAGKPVSQRMDDDETRQDKTIQLAKAPAAKANNTGLPDTLKSGIESLSGMSMDHVKVHRNSDKPATVQAHAYVQGSDIHLGPGQEKHLPHEAWHVVQQAQGRVKPTMQLKGVAVNNHAGLEAEADVMGAKAASLSILADAATPTLGNTPPGAKLVQQSTVIQKVLQRSQIDVSGGRFEDIQYEAENGQYGRGGFINMQFFPNNGIGENGDTISLVQTVKDTTRRTDTTGADATPQPTTSQLGNRKLAVDERGVDAADVGTAIDQEVLDAEGTLVNVDPRYTEERMNGDVALNTTGKTPHPHSVRSAVKAGGNWTRARLNDAPEVSLKLPNFHWRDRPNALGTVTGGMDFEVAALNNATNEFVGSVKWGWRMSGPNAELHPAVLTLADAGSATPRFFKAAAKWNNTPLIDETGAEIDPMQLPLDPNKLGLYGQERTLFEEASAWVAENPGKTVLGIAGLAMLGILAAMYGKAPVKK